MRKFSRNQFVGSIEWGCGMAGQSSQPGMAMRGFVVGRSVVVSLMWLATGEASGAAAAAAAGGGGDSYSVRPLCGAPPIMERANRTKHKNRMCPNRGFVPI